MCAIRSEVLGLWGDSGRCGRGNLGGARGFGLARNPKQFYQQLSHFFTSSYRTSWHVDVLADSPVFHVAAQAGKLIFHQPDILCVGTNANANARSWITCFF